mgnify:CR=1 FL=1
MAHGKIIEQGRVRTRLLMTDIASYLGLGLL